jgi:hypothetical protein
MARLLISMWLLLILSLSSMFFLMSDFLSERKHAELSAPPERPYARLPRNPTDEAAAVGLATVEEPAGPRAEPVEDEEPSSSQMTDDDPDEPLSSVGSANTERSKQLKSVSISAPPAEAVRPPVYNKKMKRRGALERRRVGGRFSKRRLFR